MKESHGEGLAIHTGPESCAGVREVAGEALTGVRAGWVLSHEIYTPPQGGLLRSADALEAGARPYPERRNGKTLRGSAWSETPCMHGNTLPGNREIPPASAAARTADRIGKP